MKEPLVPRIKTARATKRLRAVFVVLLVVIASLAIFKSGNVERSEEEILGKQSLPKTSNVVSQKPLSSPRLQKKVLPTPLKKTTVPALANNVATKVSPILNVAKKILPNPPKKTSPIATKTPPNAVKVVQKTLPNPPKTNRAATKTPPNAVKVVQKTLPVPPKTTNLAATNAAKVVKKILPNPPQQKISPVLAKTPSNAAKVVKKLLPSPQQKTKPVLAKTPSNVVKKILPNPPKETAAVVGKQTMAKITLPATKVVKKVLPKPPKKSTDPVLAALASETAAKTPPSKAAKVVKSLLKPQKSDPILKALSSEEIKDTAFLANRAVEKLAKKHHIKPFKVIVTLENDEDKTMSRAAQNQFDPHLRQIWKNFHKKQKNTGMELKDVSRVTVNLCYGKKHLTNIQKVIDSNGKLGLMGVFVDEEGNPHAAAGLLPQNVQKAGATPEALKRKLWKIANQVHKEKLDANEEAQFQQSKLENLHSFQVLRNGKKL